MGFGDLRQTTWDHQFRGYNVPAGSFINLPTVFAENLGHVWLDSLIVENTIQVAGKVGYRLVLAGRILVPEANDPLTYVGGFGGRQAFDVGIEVDGSLQVHGINFGQFPHFVFVTYKTTDIASAIRAGLVNDPNAVSLAPTGESSVAQASPAPVTVITPPPAPTSGGTIVTTLAPSPVASDPAFLALQQQVQALTAQVEALQTQVDALQQNLASVVATTPGPNVTPVTSSTSPNAPKPAAQPDAIPGAPSIVLPAQGQSAQLSSGATVNPYNPNGSINISALGQVVADQGGSANVTLPSGAVLPVHTGTLGGYPYTCIGTSC